MFCVISAFTYTNCLKGIHNINVVECTVPHVIRATLSDGFVVGWRCFSSRQIVTGRLPRGQRSLTRTAHVAHTATDVSINTQRYVDVSTHLNMGEWKRATDCEECYERKSVM